MKAATDLIDLDAALAALTPCAPRVEAEIVRLPLAAPFRISDRVFEDVPVVIVRLEADRHVGTGEAAGVFYLGDEPEGMLRQILAVRRAIGEGVDHAGLVTLLPAGGARNALDCALWDLQARRAGQAVWQLLGISQPRPLLTTFTLGNGTPAEMAGAATGYAQARALKLKLNGDPADADRVRAVRAARPDAWLGVDANRSLTPATLAQLAPAMIAADVQLVEQPFRVGEDHWLAAIDLPIPFAADESVQTKADVDRLAALYQVINIKLDKCGGLTEGLRMAARARALGLGVMVGNMLGTSRAMAPGWLLGQQCDVVDLDGPLFLVGDVAPAATYRDGLIDFDAGVWAVNQRSER